MPGSRRRSLPRGRAAALLLGFLSGAALFAAGTEPPVRIGVYDNPPKIFPASDGGYAGLFADLTDAIMKSAGLDYVFVPGSWLEGLDRLRRGQIDVMVDVAYTDERARDFLFGGETVLLNWGVVYVRKGLQIESFLSLEGLWIAGMAGSTHFEGEGSLSDVAAKFGIGIKTVPVADYEAAFEAVEEGRADAAVVNRIFGLEQEKLGRLERTNLYFNPSSLKYAFAKDSPRSAGLVKAFDSILAAMKADRDSPYYAALSRWLPGFVESRSYVPAWLKVALPAALAALLVALAFIGVLSREIAKRRHAEDELRSARDAAETANRAKSAFLANTSHEIRTPMNAVLGYAQILEGDPGLGAEQRGYLGKITAAGEHLLEIINEILDMSKIESGRSRVETACFELLTLLREAESMARVRAAAKGLDLVVEAGGGLPRHLIGDEGKLRQILVNLLGNAVKFTAAGEVRLRVGPGRQDAEPAGRLRVDFVVSDTGQGIEAEDLERIFDPFEQARKSAASREGTGLGLSISRKLARLMGGELSATSEPGRGSVFTLSLPFQAGERGAAEPGRRSGEGAAFARVKGSALVLVADDRDSNRDILVKMLRPLGFEVEEAGDGAEALERFAARRPDIVLLDLVMPVMDGFEALAAMRRLEAETGRPRSAVVALTASSLEEDRARVLAAGADEFVRKPFRRQALLETMARFVEFERGTAPSGPAPGAAAPGLEGPEELRSLLRPLDGATRTELAKLLSIGDIGGLRELAARTGQGHPRLSEAIGRAADSFDLEALAAALQE